MMNTLVNMEDQDTDRFSSCKRSDTKNRITSVQHSRFVVKIRKSPVKWNLC